MNTIAIKDLHYKWYLKIFKNKGKFYLKEFSIVTSSAMLGF